MTYRFLGIAAGAMIAATTALADYPVIENATATQVGDEWLVEVTLSHPDTDTGHYADGWEVLDQDAVGVGYRELTHPHVHEQPFTRSLRLKLPEGTSLLYIRAQCSIDGLDYTNAFKVTLD